MKHGRNSVFCALLVSAVTNCRATPAALTRARAMTMISRFDAGVTSEYLADFISSFILEKQRCGYVMVKVNSDVKRGDDVWPHEPVRRIEPTFDAFIFDQPPPPPLVRCQTPSANRPRIATTLHCNRSMSSSFAACKTLIASHTAFCRGAGRPAAPQDEYGHQHN